MKLGCASYAKFLVALEMLAVIVAAVFSIAFYGQMPAGLPTDADYQLAAQEILKKAKPGDAVLLDPHWAERARLYVKNVPVLNLGHHPLRDDLQPYRRLFVWSLPRLPEPTLPRTFAFLESIQYRQVEPSHTYGALTITLFENQAWQPPLYDFTKQVDSAQVYIRRGNGDFRQCPFNGNRHSCPTAPWISVGEEIREIAFKSRNCIWAPPAGAEPLVIAYPPMELKKNLRVWGGLVGQAAMRHQYLASVNLRVTIDSQPIADLSFAPGEPQELNRNLDISSLARTPHQVQFEITAPHPAMRYFCFGAQAY